MADAKNGSKKVASGVPGVDELVDGGFPEKSLIMISGSTGTGKTIFALQFLYQGAAEFNEPGVYFSLEQDPEKVIKTAKKFGWDLKPLIEKKKLLIVAPPVYKYESFKKSLTDAINEIGAKRLVIDSYSILNTYFENMNELRRSIMLLSKQLRESDCVTLAISDVREGENTFSISGFEEFAVDGVVSLSLVLDPNRNLFIRSILVRKMRDVNHSLKRVLLKITDKGIVVYPTSELF